MSGIKPQTTKAVKVLSAAKIGDLGVGERPYSSTAIVFAHSVRFAVITATIRSSTSPEKPDAERSAPATPATIRKRRHSAIDAAINPVAKVVSSRPLRQSGRGLPHVCGYVPTRIASAFLQSINNARQSQQARSLKLDRLILT